MRVIEEICLWIEFSIRNLPGGIGRKIRYYYYKLRLAKCGKNVVIDVGVIIQNPKSIYIGDNVWIDKNVILIAGKLKKGRKKMQKENSDYSFLEGELHIHKNVHIAPFVLIQAHGGVSIGENCGIAAGAKLYSTSHHHSNNLDKSDNKDYIGSTMAPFEDQFLVIGPIVMKEKSVIGLNSIVLPGTTIPEATWIGLNTYILGTNLEQKSNYGIEVAKFIKKRT